MTKLPLMRRARWFLCLLALTTVTSAITGLMLVLNRYHVVCTRFKIARDIDELCQEYQSGAVSGSLCEPLCVSKTVKYNSCVNAHFEKDEVFEATLPNGEEVVIKSVRHSNHSLHSRHRSPQITIYGRQVDPSPEAFAEKVASYLKSDFAHKVPSGSKLTLLSQMWNGQDISTMTIADMGSLWSVLQSREFALLNLFRDSGIVPKVRGICGNFYAVEKLKPVDFPSVFDLASPTEELQLSQLESALELVNFTRKLEKLNLIYCDVKSVHFGRSDSDGNVRILDADALMLKKRADEMVGSGSVCHSHSECDKQDCRGFCSEVGSAKNSGKKKCMAAVTNNTLQMFCEKLFLGWYRELHMKFPGLLMSRRSSSALRAAVRRCANPSGVKDERRLRAGAKIEAKLVRAIKEEIKYIQKNQV